MLMPKKVAPSGFPTCRRLKYGSVVSPPVLMVVFKRNSCVIAMPIEAKARDVRSHAKNVRSASMSSQRHTRRLQER